MNKYKEILKKEFETIGMDFNTMNADKLLDCAVKQKLIVNENVIKKMKNKIIEYGYNIELIKNYIVILDKNVAIDYLQKSKIKVSKHYYNNKEIWLSEPMNENVITDAVNKFSNTTFISIHTDNKTAGININEDTKTFSIFSYCNSLNEINPVVLAHELGHAIAHIEYKISGFDDKNIIAISEILANINVIKHGGKLIN